MHKWTLSGYVVTGDLCLNGCHGRRDYYGRSVQFLSGRIST